MCPGALVLTVNFLKGFWVDVDFACYRGRQRRCDAHHPSEDGDECKTLASFPVGERMHYSHVALNGHHHQEHDAAVKPGVEEKVYGLARWFSESPTPDVVISPERQSNSEQQVWQRQVKDEDVGQRFEILIQRKNCKNQTVTNETEQNHDAEE